MTMVLDENLIGFQDPLWLNEPEGIIGSLGQEAIELAASAGLFLDPWQKNYLDLLLSVKDEDYYNKFTKQMEFKWAARSAGLVVSRQNGKGSILEARELAGLFLAGDRLIIHSAHEHDTAQEAHARLLQLIQSVPELDAKVLRAPMGHGEQGIELRNGQRMRFRTRTSGGGRGFTADLVVLDEAMKMEDSFVGALLPTLSARPNPQVIYMGSAGTKASVPFGRLRSRAMAGATNALFAEYAIEYCNLYCPPDCDEHDRIDDERSWRKANPSYGIRDLGYSDIEAEIGDMSEEEFLRERLGVGDWPVDANGWLIIPKLYWEARADESATLNGAYCIAPDVAPDGSMASIAVAGPNDIGNTSIELTADELSYDNRPGWQWLVPRIKEIWRRSNGRCKFVVIDPVGFAGEIIKELENAAIKVITPTQREYAQACGKIHGGIVPRKGEVAWINHPDQEPMNKAVAALDKRPLTDSYAWSKKTAAADISPFVAATLATWGYKEHLFTAAAADPWGFYL